MNTAAIERLRAFATTHGEMAFAHLCTAALEGEGWAVERVSGALSQIKRVAIRYPGGHGSPCEWVTAARLDAIRLTNTTRPVRS